MKNIFLQVYTTPEYLQRRFGRRRLRITLSVISLALYVLTKIAVDLYAGALFIQLAFDINMYLAIGKNLKAELPFGDPCMIWLGP